jgi:hypothetical protein
MGSPAQIRHNSAMIRPNGAAWQFLAKENPLSGQHEEIAATLRPTEPQHRYLARGLTEPGGKLPLFDRDGRKVPSRIIEACIAHGSAVPWIHNPIRPEWLVCRLTPKGYAALGQAPPAPAGAAGAAGKERRRLT